MPSFMKKRSFIFLVIVGDLPVDAVEIPVGLKGGDSCELVDEGTASAM